MAAPPHGRGATRGRAHVTPVTPATRTPQSTAEWLAAKRAAMPATPSFERPSAPPGPKLMPFALKGQRLSRQPPASTNQQPDQPFQPLPPPRLGPPGASPATSPMPTARKARRGMAAVDGVLALARQLNFLGPLGIDPLNGAGGAANLYTHQLDEAAHRRAVSAANLPLLKTALTWVPAFLLATGRSMFVPAFGANALVGQVWNRTSLDMLGEFLRASTPRGKTKTGQLSGNYVSGIVGALRIFRSREARYDIAPESVNLNFPNALKAMRRDDGPSGSRARNVGIRAQHLETAANAGYDRLSEMGAVTWASAANAICLLLRGGEVGVPDDAPSIDPRRIITWGSFEWQSAAPLVNQGRPWLIEYVVPIKVRDGGGKGYPTPVPRTHDGPFLSDPVDPYDAVAWAWWIRAGPPNTPFPVDGAGRPAADWQLRAPPADLSEAFFSHANGDPFTTTHVRAIGKSIARAAGVPAEDVGAKCFRIGGATDGRAAGAQVTESIYRQRGRWDSDCGKVYSRPLVEEHLSVATGAARARGADLEALCAGFSQRAIR